MGDRLAISVVVPTYNRREIVVRSIETLFHQSLPAACYEIIVVVDGSQDGTVNALRAMTPPCKFQVIEQTNSGPASARNAGLRAADSDLILFVDDDMRCDHSLLSAHVETQKKSGEAAVFGAIFLDPESKRSLATECFEREIGSFHLRHKGKEDLEWTLGECVFSNTSIPKRIFEQVGAFDGGFRVREDLELGVRLGRNGVRMVYVREAIVYQYYDKTLDDLLSDAESFGIADKMLAQKYPDLSLKGHVKWSASQAEWKTGLRQIGVRWPSLERLFLAPLCLAGQAFFPVPPVREVGVRALQLRRRIRWLRAVQNTASGKSSDG